MARLMQSLGRRYVRYVNTRYHRTGKLWEGRYKSSAVMHDDYVLRCQRTIELNPLRSRTPADPLDYRWSSHRGNSTIEAPLGSTVGPGKIGRLRAMQKGLEEASERLL